MKNKTKTYLLLIVVLGIWGTIGYKILNGLNPNIPQEIAQNMDMTFKPNQQITNEVFYITAIERDPFLGTLSNRKKRKSTAVNTIPKQKSIENNPSISYSGSIKKQNTSSEVFVISINNKQYLLKKGQTVDSIRLIRGNSKEVVVRYKNKSLTIKRQ